MKRIILIEKVDYKKIEDITRKVVQEELSAQQSNELISLHSNNLQNIIADAIIQADEKKEEIKKEKIKNAKLSKLSIAFMAFWGIVAIFFILLAIGSFTNPNWEYTVRIVNGFKLLAVAITYGLFICIEYAVNKNKEQNFAFNLISLFISIITLLFTIITQEC